MHDVIKTVDTFLSEVREAKAFVERFILWPKRWRAYRKNHAARAFKWKCLPLTEDSVEDVPTSPGIYTLLIQPGIADHPQCSFLAYVGKAENQTLRERFKQYLGQEKSPKGRPHIIYLLNEYAKYLTFCCAPLPDGMTADQAEQALQEAYIPPYCRALPATVRRVTGAFR